MQLFLTASFILIIVLWGIVAPASLGTNFDSALAVITRNFGWLYLWVVLALVIFAAFLAFSRYGNLKLGGEEDEPEFSLGAWFAMLFAAGMGIGLVFWGVAEPMSHYTIAPPGIAANTPEAANAAMRYSFFHWGVHPWAVYSVVALAIAFFQSSPGRCPYQCFDRYSAMATDPSSGRPIQWIGCDCDRLWRRGFPGNGRTADQQWTERRVRTRDRPHLASRDHPRDRRHVHRFRRERRR